MNLINSRINELIAALSTPADATEREHNAQHLRNFIRAYGTSQRVSAVRDQHRIVKNMGLVYVDGAQLVKLNERMTALASQAGDAMYDTDVEWLNAGLQVSLAMEPREDDAELEGPEFTCPDPDVDRLLNDTAALLGGNANMDVGLSWADSLEKVLARLKAAEKPAHPTSYWPLAPETVSYFGQLHSTLSFVAQDMEGTITAWRRPKIKHFADSDTDYLRFEFDDSFWFDCFTDWLTERLTADQVRAIEARSESRKFMWTVETSLLEHNGIMPPDQAFDAL